VNTGRLHTWVMIGVDRTAERVEAALIISVQSQTPKKRVLQEAETV